MRDHLADILASCLEFIERGEHTVEECLALYPEYRDELEPLLAMAASISERADYAPRPSFQLASRARLLRRLSPRPAGMNRPSVEHSRQKPAVLRPKRLVVLWTTLLVIAVSLIGGGTVYASNEALPGDMLFPVKRAIEATRLSISDDAGDVLLGAEFAQTRLEEIQALLNSNREEDLDLAVDLLTEGIDASTLSLAVVAQEDPGRAAELSSLLAGAFSIHAEVLTSRLESVPARARPAIENAILASNRGRETVQELFENDVPGGGPPDGLPRPASTQPGGPPDELPGPESPQPGGGPPDEVPGPPSTQPGGGPPDEVPGSGSGQPGGRPPEGTPGPPADAPGRRP